MQRVADFLPILAVVTLASAARAQDSLQHGSLCEVSRISDGDSFRCRDGRRVRLTGIDTPELSQQPFGARSRQALLQWIPLGTTVFLENDVSETDRFGRRLAYAWSGSTMVNEVMVRSGWAVLYTVPPNVKYAERLHDAQKQARALSAGLWPERGFDCPPSQFRRNRCATPP
jgi:micrococcal nuclease